LREGEGCVDYFLGRRTTRVSVSGKRLAAAAAVAVAAAGGGGGGEGGKDGAR
jgi:hypothetical protein